MKKKKITKVSLAGYFLVVYVACWQSYGIKSSRGRLLEEIINI